MINAVPILGIKDLTIGLPASGDRRHAVEHVSLSVAAGQIVCLVGESGSGKSVTAHSVMGLLPPHQLSILGGRISLEGDDLAAQSPDLRRQFRGRRMAMIFQEPMTALNPVIRIGEQIAEMFDIHTKLSAQKQRRRVLDLLESVHLPDPAGLIDAFPHQISGGQRQRVMIAMALALDPVLLIADEPTTALDVTTQAQILKLIKELQARRGTAVLFITHDFGVVAEIADRVAVMQTGKIVEEGGAEEVLRRARQPYTQMLIRSVPRLVPHQRAPSDGPVVLEARSISKSFSSRALFSKRRRVAAVDDVSLMVRRGEILGVVGESGSGKSTVARCIARLTDVDSGAIMFEGSDVATLNSAALRPHRRDVQIVFQDPYRSLNPRRTVGASIAEGPRNFGLGAVAARARAEELVRLVGIDPLSLGRYPHQFSGGQRQRICIARALAMEPKILIADEAVSALDVSVQAQVLQLLDDIRRQFDLAVLFITHDLRVAAQICHRIAVMHRGRVVEEGATVEIFGNPRHEYTRALFDAAPGRGYPFGEFAAI